MRIGIALTIVAGVLCATLGAGDAAQDAEREAFEKRCSGCHALDKIKVGPPLRNVYGREAGKDPRFPYSDAVKYAAISWDQSTLDRWLTDTESVIPDNEMAFRLNDPAERANIIAYLKKLSGR